MKKIFLKLFVFIYSVICVLFFSTCNVGLGERVDTEAPSLEIEYPAISDVVRGTFNLKGTWEDDKSVESVAVTVRDSEKKQIGNALLAKVSEDKTWNIDLNSFNESSNTYEYLDGTYTVEVIATDGSGHISGKMARTFDIDNTAPVFALTSPNSININDPTNFGTILTLQGEVADDHAIQSMKAWIYDLNGNLKTTEPLSFSNIETTGGTSVVAAQYKSTDTTLDDNFKKMYDLSEDKVGTTQGFYLVVIMEDVAGNISSSCYIKSSVIDALEQKLGIDSANSVGLSSSDMKKIINGSFDVTKTSATNQSVSISELREIIKEYEVSPYIENTEDSASRSATTVTSPTFDTNSYKYVTFTLNSNANPTYEIVGYAYNGEGNDGLEETGSETSLNVKIQAGLNGYQVNPQIKIQLWATDSDINKSGTFPYAVIEGSKTTIYDTTSGEVKKSLDGKFITNSNQVAVDTLSTTVETATYTFKLPELSARKAYIVNVIGTDTKEQPLDSSSTFAFRVSSSGKSATASFGAADSTNFKNLAALSVTKDFEKLSFDGKIKSDTAIATKANPNGSDYSYFEVRATNEENSSEEYSWKGDITFPDATILSDELNSATEYDWKVSSIKIDSDENYKTVKNSLDSGACWLFEVSVNFVNGSESVRTLTRSIHIDTKKPVVKVTSISPTVINQSDSTKPKINGVVNLTGQVTETNMKELHYYLNLTDEAIARVKTVTKQAFVANGITPSNSAWNDGIQLKNPVWYNATAYASNPTVYKDYNPATTSLSVNLNISTKVLVNGILSKMGFSETSTPNLTQAQYLFDNIESELEFRAYAVDGAGNKSDEVVQSVIFAQLTDMPQISLSNAESGDVTPTSTKNMFGTSSNRNLIGTITDDDGLATATIKYRKWFKNDGTRNSDGALTDGNYQFSDGTTSTSVNFQLPSEEGEYEVQIYAKDNKGESNFTENSLTYHIAVDAGEPTLKVTTTQNSDASQNNTFTVEGTVSDGAEVNVYRYLMAKNEKNNAVGIGDATKLTVNADGKWTDTIKTGDNGDTVTYRAIDKYGFISDATFTYSIDSVKPEVEVTSIKSNDEIYEINSNYKTSSKFALNGSKLELGNSDNSGNFVTITGKWSDTKLDSTGAIDGSGTKDLQYSTDNTNWITVGGTSTTYKSGAIWSFDLPVSEGDLNLYVRATDNSNNVSDVKSITGLKVDFAKPQITNQNIASDISKRTSSEKATSGYYFVKNSETLTFTGTVSDSHGIESITPTFTIDGTAISDYTTNGITFSTTDLSSKPTSATYTIKIAGNDSNNGIWTVDVVAKDISGRDSANSTKETNSPFDKAGLIVDTVAPTWETGNSNYPLKVGGSAYDSTKWFNNTSLKFAGFYTEETSGVDEIYALVVTPSNIGSAPTDSATVIATSGVTSFTAKSAGNFETTLDGLAENTTNANKVFFVARDKAGNISSLASVDVNLDLNAPNFTSNYITYDGDSFFNASGEVLTNALKDITIYGTVSDAASGIAGLTFNVAGSAVSPTVSYSTVEIGTIDETHSFKSWIDKNDNKTDSTKQNFSSTISDSKTVKTWKAIISKSSIKSGAVKVTPKDNAGNGIAQQIFSFNADTTPPTVKYAEFTDADTSITGTQLNGKIVLSGTASDNQQLASVTKVQYQTVSSASATLNASAWTDLPTTCLYSFETDSNGLKTYASTTDVFKENTAYAWETNAIDTVALFPDSTSGDVFVYFRAIATDAAGNDSAHKIVSNALQNDNGTYSSLVYVNQNSDRPTVDITKLSANNSTLMYGDNASINGTISDDDSVANQRVKKFVVSSEAITSDSSIVTLTDTNRKVWKTNSETGTASATLISAISGYEYFGIAKTVDSNTVYDITAFNSKTGAWIFYPYNVDDGSKKMYFYAEDNEGAKFYTTASDLNKLYQEFNSQNRANSSVVTYMSDSKSPTITSSVLKYSSSSNGASATSTVFGNGTYVGGNRKYVQFVITGEDSSGIASMKFDVTDAANTKTSYNSANTDSTKITLSNGVGTSPWIDVSGLTSGSVSVVVTVYDNSGLYNNTTLSFNVDNDAPEVKVTAPGQDPDSDVVTSTTTVRGTVSDVGGVSSIWWKISKTAPTDIPVDDSDNTNDNGWTKISSVASIELPFENTTADATDNILTYATSTYADETFTGSNIFKVPVWFYAVDTAGNEVITTNGDPTKASDKHYVYVDPDAGRPTTKILYPSNAGTIGGSVTIIGKADDDISVKNVYVQLGSVTLNASGEVSKFTQLTAAQYTALGLTPITGTDKFADNVYVKAKGTNSWSLDLDTTKLSLSTNTKLGIKSCAIDNEGKSRYFSSVIGDSFMYESIDQEIPGVDNLRLVQYSSDWTVEKEKAYKSGVYISREIGNKAWYLEGVASDNEAVDKVVFTSASGSGVLYTLAGSLDDSKVEKTQVTSGSDKEWKFRIPIPTAKDGNGLLYSQLSVSDGASPVHTNTQMISINIDDTAPGLYNTTSTGVSDYTTSPTSLRLKVNQTSVLDNGNTNYIINSNGNTTLGDEFVETDSGIQYIAFYLQRHSKTNTDNRIYNVTFAKTDDVSNRHDLTSVSKPASLTSGNSYINDDGLACVYISGATRSSATTFSSTSIGSIPCITNGGIIKIGGMYTRFTKSGNTLTLADSVDTSFTTAEVILAQVVDAVGTETTDDDGDGIIENLKTSDRTWWAKFNSQNIPDGPVDITVVAIDNAGNISKGTVTTSIRNNQPRLAKLYLSTDLNANGTYEESETITQSLLKANDATGYYEAVASADVDLLASFKAKEKTIIQPEIIGGNGTIKYSTTYQTKSGSDFGTATALGSLTDLTTKDVKTKLASVSNATVFNEVDSKLGTIEYTVADNKLGGISDGEIKLNYVFWDSTEELTPGTDSYNANLSVAFTVDVVDETAPQALINPFYWHSSAENSLYKNSKDNGHIELEGDWKAKNSSGNYITSYDESTSGIKDGDPKVSGKIVVTGTVYDDKRLSKINLSFEDMFNESTLSTYSSGTWTTTTTLPTGVLEFNVHNNSLTQEGHSATWSMAVDTSKVTDVAALDKAIKVIAYDCGASGGNKNTPGSTSTTAAKDGTNEVTITVNTTEVVKGTTAYYRVDVVPYITDIETSLKSKLKSSIRGAYYRSSLGHYVVRSDETVSINGFNLTGAKYGTNSLTVTNGVASLPISLISTSGEVALTVNSVSTLNNLNNNNSKGSYETEITNSSSYADKSTYAYNRQPNQTSNNNLTDDVKFDIWEFDSDAAKPVSGKLSEPIMKINPKTGKIGFAFVSGPADFSMSTDKNSNGTMSGSSYAKFQSNYATFTNVSFTYDSLGNSHGTTTGLDTNPDGSTNTQAGKFTYVTGKWGVGALNKGDNYSDTKKIRLEGIGVPGSGDYNGTYFFVKGTKTTTYTMTETRFSSPSIAATNHGTSSSVYLAYYDDIQGQIRFRYGSTVPNTKGNFDGGFYDNEGINANGNYVFDSYTSRFSLIAGKDWQRTSTGTAVNKDTTAFFDTGYNADKYVSIDAYATDTTSTGKADNDVVAVVWYDGTDCLYSYTKKPTSGIDMGTNDASNGWAKPQVIFSDGGEHCAIKIAPDKSVHIAANVDGVLKYAYLKTVDASYDENTNSVTVDSYTDAGEQITIDVGLKSFNKSDNTTVKCSVPYISYLSNKKMPAMAILSENAFNKTTGTMNYTAQGTHKEDNSDDVFTGNWDVKVIPTSSKLSGGSIDKINVALWKSTLSGSVGLIVSNQDDSFTVKTKNTSNSSSTTTGECYGNGTSNAVVGYAIKSNTGTCLETAQMR